MQHRSEIQWPKIKSSITHQSPLFFHTPLSQLLLSLVCADVCVSLACSSPSAFCRHSWLELRAARCEMASSGKRGERLETTGQRAAQRSSAQLSAHTQTKRERTQHATHTHTHTRKASTHRHASRQRRTQHRIHTAAHLDTDPTQVHLVRPSVPPKRPLRTEHSWVLFVFGSLCPTPFPFPSLSFSFFFFPCSL